MKRISGVVRRWMVWMLLTALVLCAAGCSKQTENASPLDAKNPVTVTVWNYYNGDQLNAFDALVETFNSTVGAEKGIVIMNVSQGDINTLADSLLASVNGEAGAQETPVLAAVYSETAYILDKAGKLMPLDGYFSKEELEKVVPGFLDEGRFNDKNELLLFPILKSTELFTANQTDWEAFAAATGVAMADIATKEDLTEAAKTYYEWTDAATPDVPEDGKALYGRDSISNYIYVGCYQLGHPLFSVEDGKLSVDMDQATFRTLWDNYYIPFINGYFGAYAKFRSEDCKTGRILALTSSSSSVGYLPTAVTTQDDETHDITTYISKDLPFANAANDAVVQQGASYCLLKSTPAQQAGAVEFLKWFTDASRNLEFATMSGYMPVTLASNTRDAISKAYAGDTASPKGKNILEALLVSADAFHDSVAYAVKPFNGSKEARAILGDSLQQIAAADREKVLASIQAGATRADAVQEFATDAYFEAWFKGVKEQVQAAVA